MDDLLKKTLKYIGASFTELSESNIEEIKANFPVPKEHKVLWADVVFERRLFGLVITDKGLFIKGSEDLIKKENAKISYQKKRINNIYNYIKWGLFDVNDFKIAKGEDGYIIKFNNKIVLKSKMSGKFFNEYSSVYTKMIEESIISSNNIFSSIEAIFTETNARVNNRTGHGVMAEKANNLADLFEGKNAKVVGGDNAKNGADRIVNGQEIQTKYYLSGKRSINACFDSNGQFRYFSKSGEPMLIEVPKDQYFDAINEFRKHIVDGNVQGVTNPDDAAKFIKRGKFTYKQAVNISKAGNIDSLAYDATTGIVSCSFALGLTFITTFAINYRETGDVKESVKLAAINGIQVFGMSLFAHILTQQVARTSAMSNLIPLSDYVVQKFGYKATQTIINSLRGMSGERAISGAAASKHFSKLLRSNFVVQVASFIVFSIPDTYNYFNDKITGSQYTKNLLTLLGVMSAGAGGTFAVAPIAAKAGALVGSAITPGVGTAVGAIVGFAGGAVAGVVGGALIKAVGDYIKEDDSVIVSRMFNGVVVNMIYDYMLDTKEIDILVEKFNTIKSEVFKKLFKEIIASKKQENVIENFLSKFFDEIVSARKKILQPTPSDMSAMVDIFNPIVVQKSSK